MQICWRKTLHLFHVCNHLALHESQPSQNITDTCSTVRSSQDSLDTTVDIFSMIPALVPSTFNFSSTGNDLVQTAAELLQLVVSWLGLSRDNSKDNCEAGKDSDDLGHGEK